MATYTPHYNLQLPATSDYYQISVFNNNNSIIDTELYNVNTSLTAAQTNLSSQITSSINQLATTVNGQITSLSNSKVNKDLSNVTLLDFQNSLDIVDLVNKSCTVTFASNSITETFTDGTAKITNFLAGGDILIKVVDYPENVEHIIKQTYIVFNNDGSVTITTQNS